MKHIHAGIIAQPAGNNAHARCSHSHHAPRTQGGPPRLDSSHAAGRPTSPLYRRRPGHRFVRTPPDADKRLAAEERISRRNPTPQYPQNAANLIAHRRRTSPPTSRASVAGGADLAFAVPLPTGRQADLCAPHKPPHVGQGESQANPSRAASLQDGRQKPTARRKRFRRFAPSRINPGARPTCARRTSGRQCRGANRLNPVMKIPCRNRPHLLPTGCWSGGRAGRRRCDEAEGGASVSAAYCGRGARSRSDNNTMRGERLARRGARLYSVQFSFVPSETPARVVLSPFHPCCRSADPRQNRLNQGQSCADC